MPTNFAQPRNNATTTLASAKASGASSITVANAAPFGTPSTTRPVRITIVAAATYGQTEVLTIYTATGVSGNTLTGLAVAEGSTDRAYAVGDVVEARWTAGAAEDIHGAVNSAEAAIAAIQAAYVTPSALTTALASYVTSTSLTTALASYVTTSSLTTALASYVTTSSLTTTLASYVTTSAVIAPAKGGTGLNAIGGANQFPAANAAGTAFEWKSFVAGSGVAITHAAGTLTIAATGGGGMAIGAAVGGSPTQAVLGVDTAGKLAQYPLYYFDTTGKFSITNGSTSAPVPMLELDHYGTSGQPRFAMNTSNTSTTNMGISMRVGGVAKWEILTLYTGAQDLAIYDGAASAYALYCKAGTGRIGVNVSAPAAQLHVQAKDTTTPTIVAQAAASQGVAVPLFAAQDSTGNTRWSVDPGGRIGTTANAPTYGTSAGAGTGASIGLGAGSTDQAGVINVTTAGTPLPNAVVATLTFSTPVNRYPTAIWIQAANAATAAIMGSSQACFADKTTMSASLWKIYSGNTALPSGVVLSWFYGLYF